MSGTQSGSMETIPVDLKNSLWTADEGIWEEHAPGALDRMRAAFSGEGPVVRIGTSAGKETRSGSVIVSKGKADVVFSCEWDDPGTLADGINEHLDEEMESHEHDSMRELVDDYIAANIDEFSRTRVVPAHDFAALLEGVDRVEEDLLEAQRAFSKDFDEQLEYLASVVEERRDLEKDEDEEEEDEPEGP